jgi:hypothetical protein
VPYLARNKEHKDYQSVACIQALAKIGSDEAFSVLKTYISDDRPSVTNSLVMAGLFFNEDKFIVEICSHIHPVSVFAEWWSSSGINCSMSDEKTGCVEAARFCGWF